GQEDHHDEGDQDHADGAELALQVGEGAFLDRLGDLLHGGRALVGGQDAAREGEADPEREEGRDDGADEHEPLAAVQREVLIAAFGGKYWVHRMSLWDGSGTPGARDVSLGTAARV